MGAVLSVLARALGVEIEPALARQATTNAADLQYSLPAAPHAALAEFATRAQRTDADPCSVADIHAALCRCLPFNFH